MTRQTYTPATRCGHCGNTSPMTVLGSVEDTKTIEDDHGGSFESGTIYEVCTCPNCKKALLLGWDWHDGMEDPRSEAQMILLLPDPASFDAQRAQKAADRRFMEVAVAEAAKSKNKPGKAQPFVGAVIACENKLVASAHRGEIKVDEHAEFTALEGKCRPEKLSGATVYTTLEPCTSRGPGKIPCVERLIGRKVARVVIGMLDPNENIRGRGILALRKANIQVDLFPSDLMSHLEDLNRDFITDRETAARVGVSENTKPTPKIVDKWVGGTYADNAGIATRLKAEGYSVQWASAATESERVDLNGWEYVLDNIDATTQCRLKIRDDSVTYLVLLKKKTKV